MSEVEMLDVVDDMDRFNGAIARSELVDRQVDYRVVHVLAFDRAGDLILQQPAARL